MQTIRTNEQIMREVRELVRQAADTFDSDIDIHCEATSRACTDDQLAWHYHHLTTAQMLKWQILDLTAEFVLHSGAHNVKPRIFGRLAAIRSMVVKLGEEFPASRMIADRLLSQANDRLNYLSVSMEAERVF